MNTLQNDLHGQLINIGWQSKLQQHAKELMRQEGVTNVTLERLIMELMEEGTSMVPKEVRKEMVERIVRGGDDERITPSPKKNNKKHTVKH
mmetsp:Transcript_33568/g.57054  ORF Transcript_33568/g.57054 Transcript_33568/m.57054 type:complete len:91 (-) Transcript_33568:968-1240(-)